MNLLEDGSSHVQVCPDYLRHLDNCEVVVVAVRPLPESIYIRSIATFVSSLKLTRTRLRCQEKAIRVVDGEGQAVDIEQ
jgi:hypothetical protein